MDALLGTQAGNYRLVARLGAGGMGEVFKGVHTTIGSKVAIKVLHARAARDHAAQERFLLEAKAVNRIDHPGVVKVIDAGRLDGGRPFLVMELLDGSSLHELRKARALAIPEACRAIIDALDALAAAHAAGVIHRDLKPANIFRTREGRTVVLDFGVAKLMAADAPVRLTITGAAIGTPHYMAPEQIRGEPPSPAFDIYAIGVVLFELLCGRRPFDHADEESVLAGHLERRPPPPRALEPAIPRAVSDVILAALAKDPARRPPSAAAMRDALRAALDAGDDEPAPGPWARPDAGPTPADSLSAPTVPGKIPSTERSDTPAAVVAHRERTRLRSVAVIAGASTLAAAGVLLIVFARTVDAPQRHAPAPPPPPAEADAALVVAVDAAPDPDAFVATCAQLVTVDPTGIGADRRAAARATLFRRCEEDSWPEDVIACYLAAPPEAQAKCAELLPPAQHARLRDALTGKSAAPPRRAQPPAGDRRAPPRDGVKNPYARPRPGSSPRDDGLIRPEALNGR